MATDDLPHLADELIRTRPEALWDLAGPLTAVLAGRTQRSAPSTTRASPAATPVNQYPQPVGRIGAQDCEHDRVR